MSAIKVMIANMPEPFIAVTHDCGNVMDQISRSGKAVLGGLTVERFMKICMSIGDVLSVEDIGIIEGSRRHVSSSGAVPAHSDGPQANVVAWFCVRQDEDDGTSILFDTAPVLRGLSSQVRTDLASIQVPYYDHTSATGRPECHTPLLLGHDEGSWRVNYAPWLLPDPLDARQRLAIAAFQLAIASSQPTRIRLQPGQSLFVNNWRILHSRDSVKPDSTRLLKRAWVRTARQSEMSGTG